MECHREDGKLVWKFGFDDVPTLASASQDKPDVVYHYTDLRGADGILSSKTLWLSKISLLNDISEHIGLLELLHKGLSEFTDGSAESVLHGFVRQATQQLSQSWASNVFIFSLSAEADSLSQWRGYGDNGNGVAIGFHTESLLELLARSAQRLDFVSCIYDARAQQKIASELVQLLFNCHKQLIELASPDERLPEETRLLDYFATFLVRVAPIIKNPYFQDERECRIITAPIEWTAQDYRVELRDAQLLERFELSFLHEELPLISEVLIGPHRDAKRTEYAFRVFLLKRGLLRTIVRMSEIPYRGS